MWFMLCIITMQALCRSGTAWASCEVNPVIQWPFDFQGLTRVDDQWSQYFMQFYWFTFGSHQRIDDRDKKGDVIIENCLM